MVCKHKINDSKGAEGEKDAIDPQVVDLRVGELRPSEVCVDISRKPQLFDFNAFEEAQVQWLEQPGIQAAVKRGCLTLGYPKSSSAPVCVNKSNGQRLRRQPQIFFQVEILQFRSELPIANRGIKRAGHTVILSFNLRSPLR